jgi:hypothetical protein
MGSAVASAQAPAAPQPAPSSPLEYRSAIHDYKVYADEKLKSWRESNDTAAGAGGWRAYAREIQGGEPARDAPGGAGHGHHSGRGKQ